MDYCYDNWSEKELGKANASIPSLKTIDVKDGKESTVPVVLKSPVKVWVRNDMDTGKLTITPTLDKKQVTDNEIQAPMDKGTKIGTATITLAEDKLGYLEDNNAPSTEIITDKTSRKSKYFRYWLATRRRIFRQLVLIEQKEKSIFPCGRCFFAFTSLNNSFFHLFSLYCIRKRS